MNNSLNLSSDIILNMNDNLSTTYVAEIFKSIYSNKFVFKGNKLYFYNGIYWIEDDSIKSHLNIIIATEFVKIFHKHIFEYNKIASELQGGEKEVYLNRINELNRLILNLTNAKRRDPYVIDIIRHLVNETIIFDENMNLFAFKNKIYDLSCHKFVEPRYDQYITLHTGYDYIDEYDKSKSKEKFLNKLLDSIFPDKSVKDFYLTCLSLGLVGINKEKFIIANGGGGNGKGVLNELCQKTFGEYAYVLASNILLQPLKLGSNPEVANLNNKRIVFCREPDEQQQIISTTIRELTGGEEINARLNHSNDTKTKLKLILILECNTKPKLSEVLDADKRRIHDVPFESTFLSQNDYNKLNETQRTNVFVGNSFYKSNEFKNEFKQVFFNILIKYYKAYNKNNKQLPCSDCIDKRTREYFENSDLLNQWISEAYMECPDKRIKLKDVFNNFKSSETYNNLDRKFKAQYNYKNFILKLKSNIFLRQAIFENKDKVYELRGYEKRPEEQDEEDNDD